MTILRQPSTILEPRRSGRLVSLVAAALALSPLLVPNELAAAGGQRSVTTPFKEARMIIEYNETAEDIGVQFFLDSEGWETVEIFAPDNEQIYSATAEGRLLGQGGGTELFVESVEPSLDKLSIDEFFDRFPEGSYLFTGLSPEGDPLSATDQFSHRIPRGPRIVLPGPGDECAQGVAIPAVISWRGVVSAIDGAPVTIIGYQVIVERNGRHFDIQLPASARKVTVPRQFLRPGSDYLFEVLAIESSGNQTITEGCFRTAN